MTKDKRGQRKQDDFIAPARRAFLRVARKLRLENEGFLLRVKSAVKKQPQWTVELIEPGALASRP